MKKLLSPARTLIVLAAFASVAVGCKRAETPAPATNTTATTVPATTEATGANGTAGTGTTAATGTANGVNATGSSQGMGAATGSGAAPQDANATTNPPSAVRNNSGETQGTAPSSLPTSDGSR